MPLNWTDELKHSNFSNCKLIKFHSLYLCLINNGLPRHLKVTLLPSGMSPSLTSIFASARTSAVALIELINSPTNVLAAYAPTTAPPKKIRPCHRHNMRLMHGYTAALTPHPQHSQMHVVPCQISQLNLTIRSFQKVEILAGLKKCFSFLVFHVGTVTPSDIAHSYSA